MTGHNIYSAVTNARHVLIRPGFFHALRSSRCNINGKNAQMAYDLHYLDIHRALSEPSSEQGVQLGHSPSYIALQAMTLELSLLSSPPLKQLFLDEVPDL